MSKTCHGILWFVTIVGFSVVAAAAVPRSGTFPGPGETFTYFGRLSGERGEVLIRNLGHKRYYMHFEMEGRRGGGLVHGIGVMQGKHIVMQMGSTGYHAKQFPCRLLVEATQKGIAVAETGCSMFHGGAVSFNGDMWRGR